MVEAINGNIKSLLRGGREYKNLRYLLVKAQSMAATRTEFVVFRKATSNAGPIEFLRRAVVLIARPRCTFRKPQRWGLGDKELKNCLSFCRALL